MTDEDAKKHTVDQPVVVTSAKLKESEARCAGCGKHVAPPHASVKVLGRQSVWHGKCFSNHMKTTRETELRTIGPTGEEATP